MMPFAAYCWPCYDLNVWANKFIYSKNWTKIIRSITAAQTFCR